MVITTCGGLWRYRLGDTIRFTSVNPYKFVITGRTKNYINAFGEGLMVDNADKAIAETCRITGRRSKSLAAPLFLLGDAKGRHQWFVEFEKAAGIDQDLLIRSRWIAERTQFRLPKPNAIRKFPSAARDYRGPRRFFLRMDAPQWQTGRTT